MKYPRYAEYKDSGVEWLGQLPGSWSVTRIKSLFEITKRIAGTLGHDVLSITQQGIQIKDIDGDKGQFSMDYTKYQLVEPGDFAMNHMDLLTGYIDISRFNGVTSPDYRVFRLRQNGNRIPEYWLYVFQMCYHLKIFYAFGQGASHFGRWRLPPEAFNGFEVPIPSYAEQNYVVQFLNTELSKIDALIAEQEKLITLLKEKRQAVISHAVTKGLNPDAPMKDSGVECLGDIPSHWKTTRLKFVTDKILDCPHETPHYSEDGEYLVIRTADIASGQLFMDDLYRLSFDEYVTRIRRSKLSDNDIVYSREGERWGHAALVPETDVFCLGQRMMQFIASCNVDPCYLMWQLNSTPIYKQGSLDTVGATSPHVNVGTIINYSLTFPPIDEQKAIATYLNHETARISELIDESGRMTELLYERRSSLISAAVTGKIDVRGGELIKPVQTVVPKVQPSFLRAVFAAEIVDKLCDEPTFGHVLFQKCLYIAQYHLHIDGFKESYYRQPAGPYDSTLLRSVDSLIANNHWFETDRHNGRYMYKRLEKCGKHKPYFERYFGAVAEDLYKLLELFRKMNTRQAEIVATLYAVWNDFLIQGESVSDDQIIDEVLTNWDESKTRFPRKQWQSALDWMRQNELIPTGFGKATRIRNEKGKP